MNPSERLVAIVSPWEKINALVKKGFRLESLPAEKKVMVWRDDLQTEADLAAEIERIGVRDREICRRKTTNWKAVE